MTDVDKIFGLCMSGGSRFKKHAVLRAEIVAILREGGESTREARLGRRARVKFQREAQVARIRYLKRAVKGHQRALTSRDKRIETIKYNLAQAGVPEHLAMLICSGSEFADSFGRQVRGEE
jgi:hypothetical protein